MYSNYVEVGSTSYEFFLHFGEVLEDHRPAHIHTRIVLSPVYVKELAQTLAESIQTYEQSHGKIPEPWGGTR